MPQNATAAEPESTYRVDPSIELQVEAGYVFPTELRTITAAEQRRLHGHCAIPPERYGDWVDPALLARRPITFNTASMQRCRPEVGKVHTVHHIQLHAPLRLDAPYTLAGRFTEIADHPRGWVAHSVWDYADAEGRPVMTVRPQVMMVDPTRVEPDGAKRSQRPPPPAPSEEGFELLTEKQCTPEDTLGYCQGSDNLIHLDMAYANEFGFRAPIIAGNQTVNFLMEALALDGAIAALDVTVRFKRPVFWDDAIAVWGKRGEDGNLTAVLAVNGDGKRVAECAVASVTYQG
jgi:acyl dehydratase